MSSTESRNETIENSNVKHCDNLNLIQICGLDLNFRPVSLPDTTPVGSQIAFAAGFSPDQQATVLQWRDRSLEDISPNEPVDLKSGDNRFIVLESDGSWRFSIDGLRFDWPAREIVLKVIRELAEIAPEKHIYLKRQGKLDKLLNDDDIVSLKDSGVERLTSRAPSWELNVQGVFIKVPTSKIVVRDALEQAGINPNQDWHIFLKTKGRPKENLTLGSVIDLTRSDIEKIRLTPKDVSNGESVTSTDQEVNVQDVDNKFLNANYPNWKAIKEGGRQWLMIFNYHLPRGFSTEQVTLALEIPPTYPSVEIDMFYLFPDITLASGALIPATDFRQSIGGQMYQRWSRHRGQGSLWQMGHDNVLTHMALVESALLKEVSQ